MLLPLVGPSEIQEIGIYLCRDAQTLIEWDPLPLIGHVGDPLIPFYEWRIFTEKVPVALNVLPLGAKI
jgi:hypothetical protein